MFLLPTDWNEKIESILDFVLICLSWFVCPIVFIACYLSCRMPLPTVVVPMTLVGMISAIAFLLTKKRSEFFASRRGIVRFFRYFPPLLLAGKMVIDWYQHGTG